MKNLLLFTTILATFIVLSCNNNRFNSAKSSYSPKEVFEMNADEVILVDVRNSDEVTQQAFDVKHMIQIPLDSLPFKINEIPKDKQVILACQVGKRSQAAYDLLASKGYTNIANMQGGMNEWIASNLPTKSITSMTGNNKKLCCVNPNSKACNDDGTCKETAPKIEKACCDEDNKQKNAASTLDKTNRLEVYAFHGTRQCATCKNMKSNTQATLEKYFANELKTGQIVYQVIDVDDAKNEKLAEKFQATGTALMINKVVNGKDHIGDWSDFAFDKANDANLFIPELKEKITNALK